MRSEEGKNDMDQILRELSETPGSVLADRVIVANNAFAKSLGLAGSRVVAMYTYAGLTEPLPDDVVTTLGSESTWGLLPTHR